MSLTCLLERQIGKEISEVSYLIWYLNSLTVSGSNNYVVEILSARKILCQLLQKQHSFCLHLKHVTEKAIQVHDVNAFKEDILIDIMYFIINEVEELLKQFKPKAIMYHMNFSTLFNLFGARMAFQTSVMYLIDL